MKYTYPEIETVLEADNGFYNTLIIENQDMLLRIIRDLSDEIRGLDGKTVISDGNVPISAAKSAELLDCFVPFELNRKTLLNRITSALERSAVEAEHYEQTAQMLAAIEKYMNELAFAFPCDIEFGSISIGSLIKSCSPRIDNSAPTLAEQILDYFELVSEFEGRKLFFTLNLRSFISDEDMEQFSRNVIAHGFQMIGIESMERTRLSLERRVIIDSDLCEIS